MTSLIYYGLTLSRFYGQGGRSRISIKLDSHTLLALFSWPPLVFGVGLKKSKMFFSPQCVWFFDFQLKSFVNPKPVEL